jgi:hypothetical protein
MFCMGLSYVFYDSDGATIIFIRTKAALLNGGTSISNELPNLGRRHPRFQQLTQRQDRSNQDPRAGADFDIVQGAPMLIFDSAI